MSDALFERLAAANPVDEVATPEPQLDALLSAILEAGSAAAAPHAWPAGRSRRARNDRAPEMGPPASLPGRSRGSDVDRLPRVTARQRRGLRRGGAVALLVATAGVATAGATTNWFSARTGRSASTVEPGDSGEILRLHGTDIGAVIDRMAGDIPLPPGASFDAFEAAIAADEPSAESATGLRSSLEFVAGCQWMGSWLDGVARGDSARMAHAVRVLGDAGNWPATRSATPPGERSTQAVAAQAATRGDAAAVRQLQRANCAP